MKIKLRPGTPDDANRDYLPESIKGSDIVVNENGNNSQPYPEGLREVTGTLADGVEDRWYEYVPAGYDGTQKVPLVVGVHGGLMTGWGHAIYTSWTLAADRDGFICVFPDAHSQRMWTVEGVFDNWDPNDAPDLPVQLASKSWQENHDMKFLEALIGRMKETYNIDEGRVLDVYKRQPQHRRAHGHRGDCRHSASGGLSVLPEVLCQRHHAWFRQRLTGGKISF